MRHLVCLAILVLANFSSQAQQDYNQISIPPPNVASLIKEIEKPVSLYNGQVSVNIPLYAVKDGSAEIPFSISYNTSGFKVAEEASIVGLGWNISLGGMITQQVRGEQDDQYTKQAYLDPGQYLGDAEFFPQNMFSTPGSKDVGFEEKKFSVIPESYWTLNSGFVGKFLVNADKYQPDIYTYSFGGHSGKFYIDQLNDSIYQEKIDPKLHFEKTTISGKPGFKAIAPDGTTFFFSGIATAKTWASAGAASASTVTYFLTEVLLPDGDYIFYRYENVGGYQGPVLQTESIESIIRYGGYQRSLSSGVTDVVLLTGIETKNVYVSLNYAARLDNGERRLQSINIKSGLEQKDITFYTSYFISPTIDDNFYDASSPLTDKDTHRLRLDSVTVSGNPAHQFVYNSTLLPVKRSFAVDYWGFYNGQKSNTTLLPKPSYLKFFTAYAFNDDGACRAVSAQHAKACTLEKIVYPTKGTTTINYEANTFSNYKIPTIDDLKAYGVFGYNFPGTHISDNNVQGDKVSHYFQLTESKKVLINGTISYGTGNASHVTEARISLTRMSAPAGTVFTWIYNAVDNEGKFSFNQTLEAGHYVVSVYLPDNLGQQIKPNPQPGELQGASAKAYLYWPPDESTLVYSKGAGLRVSSVVSESLDYPAVARYFQYNLPDKNGVLMSPLTFSMSFNFSVAPEGTNCWEDVVAGSRTSSESLFPISYAAQGALVGYEFVREHPQADFNNPTLGYTEYRYHNLQAYGGPEFVPAQPSYTNGLMRHEKVLDKDGKVLRSTEYFYNTEEKHAFYGISFFDVWRGPTGGCQSDWTPWGLGNYYDRFLIYFYRLPSKMVNLSRQVEIIDGISTEKLFTYNAYGLVTSEKENFSSGAVSSRETKTTYYSSNLPNWGEKFIVQHLPLETTTMVNGVQQKKTQLTFQKLGESTYFYNNIKVPHYKITSQKIFLNTFTSPQELSYSYSFYKPTQIKSYNGEVKVYLWGYKGTRVIAEITGMTENEVLTKINDSGCGLLLNDVLISNYDNSDATLFTKTSTLRNSLMGMGRMSSYTHKILDGVSTISDFNGRKSYFQYDSAGRLHYVKDDKGNIVQQHSYHFRTILP
jgi:hypothetical protein